MNTSERKVIDKKAVMSMTTKKSNAVMEQLWLTYFNDSLYAKGVITETERNKMRVNIKRRSAEIER